MAKKKTKKKEKPDEMEDVVENAISYDPPIAMCGCMPSERQLELQQKLGMIKIDVASRITGLEKTGKNKFQNYNYVTDEVAVKAVKAEMQNCGLGFAVEVTRLIEVRPGSGKNGSVYTIEMRMALTDLTTGYREIYMWMGQGCDGGDKGLYKAITGGVKYFLMKTFLLPTGDDPEYANEDTYSGNDDEDDSPAEKAKAKAKKKKDKAKPKRSKNKKKSNPEPEPEEEDFEEEEEGDDEDWD